MSSPVKPSDFEALQGAESDTFCARLLDMMRLIRLWYLLINWMLNGAADEFSTDFKTAICTTECLEEDDEV